MRSHECSEEAASRRPHKRVRLLVSIIGWLMATSLPSVCPAAEPLPRSVLIIDQLGPNGPFNTAIASGIRAATSRDSGAPVSIYTEFLDLARFDSPEYDAIMRTTLEQKYGRKPIGVILVIGFEGLQHVLAWRKTLWPEVPVVFAFINEASLAQLSLPSDVTGRTFRLTFRDGVVAARLLVPGLKRLALIGEPLALLSSKSDLDRELAAYKDQIEIIDLMGLTMAEIKRRVATLHLKGHHVTVETALTGELAPVLGDRVQLQQVVLNLVMNAAEAMALVTDRPRLLRVVSESYDGLGVLVRVEDSGRGIDPGDANRVCQPFFTTKAKGMGMGLAICRDIAEAHHGKLWASPGPRFGTVFHLVLPAAEQRARDAKARGQAEKVLHDGPVKVA
jgi:Histidine kinase-, DNA gyrase B-, and HSP90-like ATPase